MPHDAPWAIEHEGCSEGGKGLVHLAILIPTSAAMCYNALAWAARREGRLLANTLIYAGLVAFEVQQIVRHLKD